MNITVIDAIISGGIIAILLACLLTVFSFVSWGIITAESITLARDRKTLADVYRSIQSGRPISDDIDSSWRVLQRQHSNIADECNNLRQKRLETIYATVSSMNSQRLSLLASIGSNAPFIGLLGTVTGVMTALENISVATMITPADIGPPVGEALVMTAFGLFVAMPAVVGYNILNEARIRRAVHIERVLKHLEHREKNEAIDLERDALEIIKSADDKIAKQMNRTIKDLESNIT